MSAINFIENEETEKLEPKVLACLYMLQLPDNKAPNNADVNQFAKTHTFVSYNTIDRIFGDGDGVVSRDKIAVTKDDFLYALKFYCKSAKLREITAMKFPAIQKDIWVDNIVSEHLRTFELLNRDIEDLKTRVVNHDFLKNDLFQALKKKEILEAFYNINNNKIETLIHEYRSLENVDEVVDNNSNSKSHGIYKIAKAKWGAISKGLERCKELLGEEFSYEIKGEDVVDQTNNRAYYDGGGQDGWSGETIRSKIPVYVVEINCKVKEQEWEVAAIVKHTEGQDGVIVTPINKDLAVPESYNYITKIDCDHCHAPRRRNLGFIVYNHNTHEYKIVGSDCLNVYTKINPSGLLALNNVFNEIDSTVISVRRGKVLYDVTETLIAAQAAISLYGYRKADTNQWGGTEDPGVESTKERVRYVIDDRLYSSVIDDTHSSMYGVQQAAKALLAVLNSIKNAMEEHRDEYTAKAKEIKEFYKNLDTTSDPFQQKLKVVLSDWAIPKEQVGLVACIPHLYAKSQQKAKEAEAKKASSANDNVELTNSQPVGNNNLGGNVTDWDDVTRCDIKITKDAIYKIIVSENQTTYGSYPVTIYVRGNDGDNNKCGRIQTFVNDRFNPDDIEMITGKANGINYFRDTYSGKLSYPKFWTKEMVEQANSSASDEDKKEKYKEKERITIKVSEVSRGQIYASGYGYNGEGEYAVLTIKDENGDTFKWSCSTSLIYNPESLVGKKLKATVKQVKKDAFDRVLMYIITRGIVQG